MKDIGVPKSNENEASIKDEKFRVTEIKDVIDYPIHSHREQVAQFYAEVSAKAEAFDPLERDILMHFNYFRDWHVQSLTVKELRKRLTHYLKPIKSKQIKSPILSHDSAQTMKYLFKKE